MTTGARLFGRHRRAWLTAGAAVIAGVSAALVPQPPITGVTTGAPWAFAALAAAAIVALVILPFLLWPAAARPKVWVIVAIASLAFGLVSFATAGYAQRACMARYGDSVIVIGTELTPLGEAYRRANPDLSVDDLLFDAAGVPERIWMRSSIDRCTILIASTYFLWVPFLVVCLMSTAQAVPTSILAPMQLHGSAPGRPAELQVLYDAFVSYRHGGEDTRFARDLVAALEAEGYRVAIDERDFAANASFLQEMERAIRQSRFTIAVISARYLESGNAEEEALITKVLDMGDRKRRLIPITIEPVVMPVWLYGIVGIDWTKHDPLVDPFDKLKVTLGSPVST